MTIGLSIITALASSATLTLVVINSQLNTAHLKRERALDRQHSANMRRLDREARAHT